ncbi:hypothetical protein [Algibacillus agarilyticus]|uniref:hypothetical protein n=1 Tax=Algibacillus agarilyticus TaxID=2234133 RepID=UPI000DD07B99|nr:hypothetical protein [Algibacillus agarilyticus]
MHTKIGFLFMLSCIATFLTSASVVGFGFWGWLICVIGIVSCVTQYYPRLRGLGSLLALLLALGSGITILCGLLASTIGGSFKIEDGLTLLLFMFFVTAILGLTFAIMFKKQQQTIQVNMRSNEQNNIGSHAHNKQDRTN